MTPHACKGRPKCKAAARSVAPDGTGEVSAAGRVNGDGTAGAGVILARAAQQRKWQRLTVRESQLLWAQHLDDWQLGPEAEAGAGGVAVLFQNERELIARHGAAHAQITVVEEHGHSVSIVGGLRSGIRYMKDGSVCAFSGCIRQASKGAA